MSSIELHNEIVAQRNGWGSFTENELITKHSNALKPRIGWIDSSRGFAVLFFILLAFSPPDLENDIIRFFTAFSPSNSRYMNVYDIGGPAFLFVIGLSMPLSIWSRVRAQGSTKAIIIATLRCSLFIILGLCGSILVGQYPLNIIVERDDITVLKWNLVTALGLSMSVACPLIFIEHIYIRLFLAYLWIIFYHALSVYFPYFRDYAQASGITTDSEFSYTGIFVSFFAYPFFIVAGSVMTDFIFNNQYGQNQDYQIIHFLKHGARNKYLIIFLFGIFNLVLGIGLSFVRDFYISRQEASLTFNLVAVGIGILITLLFVLCDQVLYWEGLFIKYVQILGIYTAFSLVLCSIIMGLAFLIWFFINESDIVIWIGILIAVIVVSVTDIILYKKQKTIPTEIVFAFLLILAVVGIAVRLIIQM